jgi:hypothetical protein
VDFEEVFAPVARLEAVRLLMALAAEEGWQVHHMDVKTTFLNGELQEVVCVQQPSVSSNLDRNTRHWNSVKLCMVYIKHLGHGIWS